MPDVTRLRSTPSMERLWEEAERQEEGRLKAEVEKDLQAKKQQRLVDTLEIENQKEKRRLEEEEKRKAANESTLPQPPKKKRVDEVGCAHVTIHYLKYCLIIIALFIVLLYVTRCVYEFIIEYQMIHQSMSIILTGDPGNSHGVSDAYLIEEHLTHKNIAVLKDSLCDRIVHGWLFDRRVLLVSTGIGHDRAAVCVTSLLAQWGAMTNEVIFLGTSGFSPARGGIINSDSCDSALPHSSIDVSVMGDVCVSRMALNWDYQTCMFPDAVDSACFAAECSRHDKHNILYGQLEEGYYAQDALSNEVVRAMRGIDLPPLPPIIEKLSHQYWAAMSNGTRQTYTPRSRPTVFNHDVCGEVSSDFVWEGAPYDEVARKYIAQGMKKLASSKNVSSRDVFAVSAMEGIGWMSALHTYQRDIKGSIIPSVNIRGASNHVHPPLKQLELFTSPTIEEFTDSLTAPQTPQTNKSSNSSLPPSNTAQSNSQSNSPDSSNTHTNVWRTDEHWASEREIEEYNKLSREYAVNTTSYVVLVLFERRFQTSQSANTASVFGSGERGT
mmetsp:Transcript_219/g.271  ORF Transcript_219/g.271 Transcript_219/m.271 type:complete len:553 (+) Transcript_219:76-1734(+)